MDPSDFPISRSPRKELQGPRPPALKVHKDSYKIKKPPVAPQQQQQLQQQTQPRPPVIIYTVSPKVIHTNPSDFMTLVQRLTGSSSSSMSDDHCGGAISPAARYATIEKANTSSPPKEKKLRQQQQQISGDHEVGFVEEIEMDKVMERSGLFPGILSPGPASLPPIPPNYFSPLPPDINPSSSSSSVSFFHDFSPAVLHGNRNIFEGSFLPSPSTFSSISPHITSPTPSIDLFNNFNNFNNFFDF